MYLELRHLRYFIAVAEELNFSRAAARLRIAQPALSAQIRALERHLGCQLFVRTTRKVELTANGRALLTDAREIVGLADEAVAKLQAAARGERGLLRVGFVAHGAGEIGTEILRRFADAFPGVTTQLVESATLEELQRSVREHATDVAFAWLPLLCEELLAQPVRSEHVVVAMPPGHHLASLQALTASDVTPEPIVAPWEDVPFSLLAPWLGRFRPDGRRPDDPNGTSNDECLATASRGLAVYCVPDSVARFYSRPDIVFRPVVDVAPGQVAVVWHREMRNPAVEQFVEITRAAVAVAAASDPLTQSDSF